MAKQGTALAGGYELPMHRAAGLRYLGPAAFPDCRMTRLPSFLVVDAEEAVRPYKTHRDRLPDHGQLYRQVRPVP